MISFQYSFKIDEEGNVTIQNRDKFLKDMSNFPNTLFTATFKKASKKRTVRQNNYFHGYVVTEIQQHLLDSGWKQAYSFEWVKNLIKAKCLLIEEVNEETGESFETIGETSELSTVEFMQFIERIQIWAMDDLGGLNIRLPNEELTIDFDAPHNRNSGMYPQLNRENI